MFSYQAMTLIEEYIKQFAMIKQKMDLKNEERNLKNEN